MAEQKITRADLIKVDVNTYEIPQSYRADMRVPARVFMTEAMMDDVLADRALWQLVNVATLPGIKGYAYGMPDIHQGYGFPIGGVAALAIDQGGVISPGGIGYDINCGVRLMVCNTPAAQMRPLMNELATALYNAVPSGVGQAGSMKITQHDLNRVLQEGAQRMLELGYGTQADIDRCQEYGRMSNADHAMVSEYAKRRGLDQLGTLGSGNHFLEIQQVDELFDPHAADVFGLYPGALTVMIHCGSRGLGHQVCTDYVRTMMGNFDTKKYHLPDRELVYAPFKSNEGQEYFSAMAAASNYAWANRHMISHWVRQAFKQIAGNSVELNLLYDLSHNIGKVERHKVDGAELDLVVHRKGATRAFGPGHPDVVAAYRAVGQPVLIPGTMGTASYVLVGTKQGMDVAFGSSCHGAGRRLSRIKAKSSVRGSDLRAQLEAQGIIIRSDSDPGLAEEAPCAYKDVEQVVSAVHTTHLAHKVARLKPLAVIKGG